MYSTLLLNGVIPQNVFLLFVREEHRCKSFKWFMEEIAYDIPVHYPLPPKNVEWGEVCTSTLKYIFNW